MPCRGETRQSSFKAEFGRNRDSYTGDGSDVRQIPLDMDNDDVREIAVSRPICQHICSTTGLMTT